MEPSSICPSGLLTSIVSFLEDDAVSVSQQNKERLFSSRKAKSGKTAGGSSEPDIYAQDQEKPEESS